MAIGDDILFDLTNKIVKREAAAGSTVYSVNALYSLAQDTFDELTGTEGNLAQTMPMSAQTPTSYTMINGWYIQEELTQYLNGGAIQTSGYNGEIRTLICGVTGWTNFIASDIGKTITGGTTGDTGTVVDYDNTNYKIWVRMDAADDLFDNATEAYTVTAGTGAGTATAISTTGETIFANPYTLGTLEGTPQLYIYQNGSLISQWWGTGHFDILIKVTETDVDIASKAIIVSGRNFSDTYDTFAITLTTAGQNAVPLNTADDPNNQTALATVEDWQDGTISSIAIAFEFTTPYTYDIGDGNGSQPYNVQIDCNNQTLDKVYEVCKYWTRQGSTTNLETQSDGNTVTGDAYRYAKNTYAEVKPSPLGTYAGGKFFGARGVYFTNLNAADAQNFQLIDNNGVTRNPPNYQAFTVTGTVSGDRVAVFESTGAGLTTIKKNQYTSHATNNVAGGSTFEATASFPNDTPDAGTLIVVATDENEEHFYRYASISGAVLTFPVASTGTATGGTTSSLVNSGATFLSDDIQAGDIIYDSTNGEYAYVVSVDSDTTITTTAKTTTWSGAAYETNSLVQAYDSSDTAYVPYIYAEATTTSVSETTTIYVADRNVVAVVRKKGIIPFETTGTYSATGYSTAAIRTTDSIVT